MAVELGYPPALAKIDVGFRELQKLGRKLVNKFCYLPPHSLGIGVHEKVPALWDLRQFDAAEFYMVQVGQALVLLSIHKHFRER